MFNLLCIILIVVWPLPELKKKLNEKKEKQKGSQAKSGQQTNGPQVNSEVEKLRKENEDLKRKNTNLEQKNKDLELKNTGLEQEIKNLKQENQELKNQVEELTNKTDPGPGQPPPIQNKEILFFPVPSLNGVFKEELGSTIQRTNISYYRFVLESESQAKVYFQPADETSMQTALNSPEQYIFCVCAGENVFNQQASRIETTVPGIARKNGTVWQIRPEDKLKIKFV
jgi:uncharacterized phage infection (PIP) family protein YhgE